LIPVNSVEFTDCFFLSPGKRQDPGTFFVDFIEDPVELFTEKNVNLKFSSSLNFSILSKKKIEIDYWEYLDHPTLFIFQLLLAMFIQKTVSTIYAEFFDL
jgi:hypothetical protein